MCLCVHVFVCTYLCVCVHVCVCACVHVCVCVHMFMCLCLVLYHYSLSLSLSLSISLSLYLSLYTIPILPSPFGVFIISLNFRNSCDPKLKSECRDLFVNNLIIIRSKSDRRRGKVEKQWGRRRKIIRMIKFERSGVEERRAVYSKLRYSTVQYSTVQYSAAQCSTVG